MKEGKAFVKVPYSMYVTYNTYTHPSAKGYTHQCPPHASLVRKWNFTQRHRSSSTAARVIIFINFLARNPAGLFLGFWRPDPWRSFPATA
jgi:hypothetical protein